MFSTLKRSFEDTVNICETTHLQVEQPSEASTHYIEDQEYMFLPGKNVNQSSLPEEAFQQSATEAELAHLCGDLLTWQAF